MVRRLIVAAMIGTRLTKLDLYLPTKHGEETAEEEDVLPLDEQDGGEEDDTILHYRRHPSRTVNVVAMIWMTVVLTKTWNKEAISNDYEIRHLRLEAKEKLTKTESWLESRMNGAAVYRRRDSNKVDRLPIILV